MTRKLNRTTVNVRVAADTPEKLKAMAYQLGYIYDGEGATGKLLDAIALHSDAIVAALQSSLQEDKERLLETISDADLVSLLKRRSRSPD